ncbi:alkylation response protein AidB-like acyl-CoA dehydrogenase [Streptacidiphilus sp. MAP12-33]|uniref:hydrolase n=1 Tax=Streptacidiphilus sp. MAP12-33 TaxID=3156266 RepID=UPI003511E45E
MSTAAPLAAPPAVGESAAFAELLALAAREAELSDATRELSPGIVTGLRAAGFARHFVARRFGGTEGTFAEFFQAVLDLSSACAATGWCAALLAASSRYAAHLPEAGHEAVWGPNADALIATGLVPAGEATAAVGSGWRLSGRWQYISGVTFADWALLCAKVAGEDGLRFFALPRGSYEVVESWDCVGMRATGSHTVVVEDVFVPAHLSFARQDMETGVNAWSDVAAHNVPFQAIGATVFALAPVGAAQGALRAASAAVAGKRLTDTMQLELVRASARIDAARHLVEVNATVVDDRAFTPRLLARNQRNAAFAAEQAAEAVAALLRAVGTAGLTESSPLQRLWRDVTAATSHIALRYDVTRAAANYTAALTAA